MCCRFYTDDGTKKDIISLVGGYDRRIDWLREGDVCPAQQATVITGEKPGLWARDMRWGFELAEGKLLINARAESAAKKKSFAESLASRRCVIPASGFYEWDRAKDRVGFTLPGSPSVYLAGIWKKPEEEEKEGREDRFTILTTAANASMQPVHDRMPLILTREQIVPWLTDAAAAADCLRLIPPELSLSREYEQLDLFSFL